MKRVIIIMLITVLLLSSLISCSRRNQFEDELESQKQAESQAYQPQTGSGIAENFIGIQVHDDYTVSRYDVSGYATSVIKKTSDKGFFEGKTKEELYALYQGNSVDDGSENFFPTGRIITGQGQGDTFFYNKLTGNISSWCPDPLCDHNAENCIFNMCWNFYLVTDYISDEYIYFRSTYNDEVVRLYRCDHERNNVEKIYNNAQEVNDIFCEKDGILYFTEYQYVGAGQSSRCNLLALDLATMKTTVINKKYDFNSIFMMGDTVIFSERDDIKKYYKTDLSFETVELLFECVSINAYTDRYITYLSNYTDVYTNGAAPIYNVYDIKTGKDVELGAIYNPTISGDYIYYRERMSDEEIEKSSLKEFYTYTWDNEKTVITRGSGDRKAIFTYSASTGESVDMAMRGRIMRMKLDGTERECVLEMTYEGIPCRIDNFVVDGECIWFSYNTYKEFRNVYNQTWSSITESLLEGADVEGPGIYAKGTDHAVTHLAMADLQNGTVRIIEPADRDIWNWFD